MTNGADHRGPAILGLILLVIGGAAARFVDVPRVGYGLKSDEATYVAASLSFAYDGDFVFERRDLERFAGLYQSGPNGIFLKRGKDIHGIALQPGFPFVALAKTDDQNPNRLYFGKSLAYPIIAAPFVRLFGLNGLLVLQVLLVAVAALAGYLFVVARSSPLASASFVTAFLGASILPFYGAFLMPEVMNVALVTVAYLCWLYKEVRPDSRLSGRWSDVAAAALLGLCTYSKPLPTAVLVAPLVLLAWHRRRWAHGVAVGATAVLVAALFFGLNAAVSGEFNYQGGDRKVFYGRFPFDTPDATWERRGGAVSTDTSTPRDVLTSRELASRLSRNASYFLLGRHFGFVPYFFPGFVAIVWWLSSGTARRDVWRWIVFGAGVVSALVLLILLPWTWNGDGGPLGNRYFLTAYPVLLFLVPPGASVVPGVLAWLGGALFTAKVLASPFVAAKFPYLIPEQGAARYLPVELTMANTMPMRLAQPLRGRVQYGHEPPVFLYFLDQNAWPPESNGMWISAAGRADIIVRVAAPFDWLEVEAESPLSTTLALSVGRGEQRVRIEPGKVTTFRVAAAGVRGFGDYNYLMRARATDGFVPHLVDPASPDYRNLSVRLRFRPVAQGS